VKVARQLLDGQVEVPVPPVVLDRVVVEAEGVHGLIDPVLAGDALEAVRPGEDEARVAGQVPYRATGPNVGGDQLRELGGR
jgi:hypothetical protein